MEFGGHYHQLPPPHKAPPVRALLSHHGFHRGLWRQQGAHGDPQAALGTERADAQRQQRAETQGRQQRGGRHGGTEDLQQNLDGERMGKRIPKGISESW